MPNEPEADRVNMWPDMFESAKSKTYNVKNQCYMPCKHGLGYTRLVGMKNGPAMFGAWVAMIQVLSRQPKPRNGFITEDGTAAGRPLTADDVATLIRMPVPIVAAMLKACQSDKIHWIIRSKDTAGILEGYDKDTSRIEESVYDGSGSGKGKGKGKGEGQPGGNGSRLSHCDTYGEFGKVRLTPDEHAKLVAKHGADTVDRAISALDAWKESKGKTTKNDYAAMDAASWVWRAAEDAKNSQPHESIFT